MAIVSNEERLEIASMTPRNRGCLLNTAVTNRDEPRVTCVLEFETDPNKTVGQFALPVLCIAVVNRDLGIAQKLLEKGADPHFRHPHREDKVSHPTDRMPLCIASSVGDIDMVKLLIDYKADVDIKDFRGDTPLYYAIRAKNHRMVSALLHMGATLNTKNAYGRSPLDEACEWCPEVVELLKGSTNSTPPLSSDTLETDSDCVSEFSSGSEDETTDVDECDVEVSKDTNAQDREACERLQEAIRQHLPSLAELHAAFGDGNFHNVIDDSAMETVMQAAPPVREASEAVVQCVKREDSTSTSAGDEQECRPELQNPSSCSPNAFEDQFFTF